MRARSALGSWCLKRAMDRKIVPAFSSLRARSGTYTSPPRRHAASRIEGRGCSLLHVGAGVTGPAGVRSSRVQPSAARWTIAVPISSVLAVRTVACVAAQGPGAGAAVGVAAIGVELGGAVAAGEPQPRRKSGAARRAERRMARPRVTDHREAGSSRAGALTAGRARWSPRPSRTPCTSPPWSWPTPGCCRCTCRWRRFPLRLAAVRELPLAVFERARRRRGQALAVAADAPAVVVARLAVLRRVGLAGAARAVLARRDEAGRGHGGAALVVAHAARVLARLKVVAVRGPLRVGARGEGRVAAAKAADAGLARRHRRERARRRRARVPVRAGVLAASAVVGIRSGGRRSRWGTGSAPGRSRSGRRA